MALDDINLCDLANFEHGFPHDLFTRIRQQAPVWFHPPTKLAPGGEGFWVVSGYEPAKQVLQDHQHYSSETGGDAREGGGTTLEDFPRDSAPGQVLSMMDPPKHDDIRALVSQGFFPRRLKRLEEELTARVSNILATVPIGEPFNFIELVAAELPLQAICSMAGVPQEDRHLIFQWTNSAVEYAGRSPEDPVDKWMDDMMAMAAYAGELIAKQRETPMDCMLSEVIHATIPGEDGQPRALDDMELLRFFALLMTGGSETTRNAISSGLLSLVNHPEQFELLKNYTAEVLPTAVEEILRWTSPVTYNRRTAFEDVELCGHTIKRGDKVTVWYPSVNRDEAAFEKPFKFDLTRAPNPQMSFGRGIHHCLGANLARMEIRLMYEQLIPLLRDKQVEILGEPVWLRSNKHGGMMEMMVRIS